MRGRGGVTGPRLKRYIPPSDISSPHSTHYSSNTAVKPDLGKVKGQKRPKVIDTASPHADGLTPRHLVAVLVCEVVVKCDMMWVGQDKIESQWLCQRSHHLVTQTAELLYCSHKCVGTQPSCGSRQQVTWRKWQWCSQRHRVHFYRTVCWGRWRAGASSSHCHSRPLLH